MRSITGPELTVLQSAAFRVTDRVLVFDADSQWRDLTALVKAGAPTENWLIDFDIDENVDQPVSQATVHLRRASGSGLGGAYSLAPLREDSPFNLTNASAYAPLINPGRRIRIERACTSYGVAPIAGDFKCLFEGRIDSVDSSGPVMEVTARDLGGLIVDRISPFGHTYAAPDTAGMRIDLMILDILQQDFDPDIDLYVPVAPTYVAKQYKFERISVMDAVQQLAQVIGWDLRYRWHDGLQKFRLTFQDPQRNKVIPDATVGYGLYTRATRLKLDATYVRNHIKITYGLPGARRYYETQDIASVALYDRQVLQIEEASDSPISTESEAAAMAAAILADIANPFADFGVEMLPYWPVQLQDLIRFTGNGIHFNQDQDLSVVQIKHRGGPEGSVRRTEIACRGKPAGQYLTWIARSYRGPDTPPETLRNLNNFRFTDSLDGTQRTFTAYCGSAVKRVLIYDVLEAAPPNVDPWPTNTTPPTSTLLPDTSGFITYTVTKPSAGKQRFIQFEPRLDDMTVGVVRRVVVDPHPMAMAPKIKDAIQANQTADLTVDVVGGPSDWPVQVDVFEDDPASAAIYSASYSANTVLTKASPGAAALGGRTLLTRSVRRWWVRQTNVGGQEVWNSCTGQRSAFPGIESGELIWDEATKKLRARFVGGANVASVKVELDDNADFSSPSQATTVDPAVDGSEYTVLSGAFSFADRAKKWYARFTPYNQAALGGLVGSPLIAEMYVPVVVLDGQETGQMTIEIDATGSVAAKLDGPAWCSSIRYKVSTSSQPTDADVINTGTTSNSRQLSLTALATLALGATVYITAIPFSAINAGDYQGPSFRGKATRHDFSATKTVIVASGSMTPMFPQLSSGQRFQWNSGYVGIKGYNQGTDAGTVPYLCANILVPDGCTLTSISWEVYDLTVGGGGSATAFVYCSLGRIDASGAITYIVTHQSTKNNWEVLTDSINETNNGKKYRIEVSFNPLSLVVNPPDDSLRFSYCSYTYTMPSSVKAI